MKPHLLSPLRIILPAILLAAGAASCATGPEGEVEGNGAALSGRGPGPRGAFAEQRVAELTNELGLSDEQAARIHGIFEEGHQRGPDGRAQIHEKIAEVLTPEQRARFAQLPVERRLERLTERLGLDEQQVAQVRTILQGSFTQMQQTLASTPAGPDRHEAMADLHEEARAKIAAVLTPAQRETFDATPAEGFGPGGHHGRGGFGPRGAQGGGACGCGGEGCPGACGGEGCPGACGGMGGGGMGMSACGGGEGCPGGCGGMGAAE